ncbi:acylphosphatase [Thermosediminibacter oceani]|uniref:acylphosphatase n=1 Tax=Thermosediminibacter oceani (strain ATCC BAA-1034 / DSM 16646 / JW/IW-1228P) TaxID=555079 RepID=D9S210_THEOJ|nr:acylphosphatase [Thermosediminibacter oceani]ADL07437.1 acylphosphatase [Thermosediminibacter oceani DSM 16646]
MKRSARALIYGMVQGVGLRYSVHRKASQLGLTGFVKNLPDGSVELVVEGDEALIKDLLEYIKTGLRWARVDRIDVDWSEYEGKHRGFEIAF